MISLFRGTRRKGACYLSRYWKHLPSSYDKTDELLRRKKEERKKETAIEYGTCLQRRPTDEESEKENSRLLTIGSGHGHFKCVHRPDPSESLVTNTKMLLFCGGKWGFLHARGVPLIHPCFKTWPYRFVPDSSQLCVTGLNRIGAYFCVKSTKQNNLMISCYVVGGFLVDE